MADLATEVTYTDLAEFQLYTRVASQKTISDDDWKPHALHAEIVLDSYIGGTNRADSTQELKFPITDDDGISDIPADVKKAHIEITMDLITRGDAVPVETGSVKSEQWNSTGYSKTNATGSEGEAREGINVGISPIAKRLLRRYLINVAPLTY